MNSDMIVHDIKDYTLVIILNRGEGVCTLEKGLQSNVNMEDVVKGYISLFDYEINFKHSLYVQYDITGATRVKEYWTIKKRGEDSGGGGGIFNLFKKKK